MVVKGGSTRGIECPPRVLELAREFRFRSIRGDSGGAIAAAVTAAAEYGRERGGFEKLEVLNEWLAGGRHRLDLFQPTRATRPLLALLLAFERRRRAPDVLTRIGFPAWAHRWFVVIPGALRDAMPMRFWLATALGGVVGGAMDVLLARGLVDPGHPLARTVVAIVLPMMFIGSFVASLGACAWRLWRIASVEVPAQGFGICTGMTPGPTSKQPALTDWLHERIQDLADLPVAGPPLTVGALSAKRLDGIEAGIGFVLPAENEDFLFREDEMRLLFPGSIVDYMVATAPRTNWADPGLKDYLALPRPMDMPVLVLARMSLRLPILLSAVPLYAVQSRGTWEPMQAPVQRVWVSSSGLESNGPIPSVEAESPSRPTIGVDLTGGVFVPAAWRSIHPAIGDLVSLQEFLAAISTTAASS